MTKIAILSDIHGNMTAFSAVTHRHITLTNTGSLATYSYRDREQPSFGTDCMHCR